MVWENKGESMQQERERMALWSVLRIVILAQNRQFEYGNDQSEVSVIILSALIGCVEKPKAQVREHVSDRIKQFVIKFQMHFYISKQ